MSDPHRSSDVWGVRLNDGNHINNQNTTTSFSGPQFIVDSDGNSLNLSLSDKKSVISHPFNAGLNQQWLVYEDGNGGVAVRSKYNRTYLALKDSDDHLEVTKLVSRDAPFWFGIVPGRVGRYKLAVLGTDLGVNLVGEDAKLDSLSSIAGLFILENTPKSENDIISGQLIPSATPTKVLARSIHSHEYNTGANINIDLSNFTSDGVRSLVINLRHPQKIASRSINSFTTSDMKNSPIAVKEPENLQRIKLVISEDLPVPAANGGTADIVGFGVTGVAIVRNSMNIQKREVIPSFGYDAGWQVDKHIRLVADTAGNKRGDLVGFGEMGVWISQNNGDNTFQAPKMVLPEFCYAAGWRVDKHPRFMADIRNTGRADIIGFGDDGVFVSLNNGDGTFSPASLATSDFCYNGSWRSDKHPRFLADVNGNGFLDIVGFGESQVWVAYNNGDGTFRPSKKVLSEFCYSASWRVDQHPRFVADMTGNGKPDLVGFAHRGVYVAFNNGDGTFQPIRKVLDNFCLEAGGWLVEKHPRFIADLTGNGCGDIIGFGEAGVHVAINNGDGTFQPTKVAVTPGFGFGYNNGWRVKQNPRLVVDLTGDGRADIIGFGNTTVYVSYNDGKGNFKEPETLIQDFGCDEGWTAERTVRYVANLFH